MPQEPLVRDAMLRRPTVHPADLTVAEARAAFDASPKFRLILLVRDGALVSTLLREDLVPDGTDGTDAADSADAGRPAADRGTLAGRTITADAPLVATHEAMVRDGRRRLAVVAADGRLVGLLCLKRSQSGFCTDDGVAGMRRSRARSGSR